MAAKFEEVEVALKFPELFELKGKWVADQRQQQAAWELYVELATRISVVPLAPDEGLLREALSSLHALFGITREVLRRHGPAVAVPAKRSVTEKRDVLSFAFIAVAVLNRAIRPFLARWHPRLSQWEKTGRAESDWPDATQCREQLESLRRSLLTYARCLERAAGLHESLLPEG